MKDIVSLGVEGWLDEQFVTRDSSYADLAAQAVRADLCISMPSPGCWDSNYTRQRVAMRFYANAVQGQDQLRQRVAFALAQLVVSSDVKVESMAGVAAYNQIFLDRAFGNYRDLLHDVTMSTYMGVYLDMTGSAKKHPSENYARELVQLFTMGPDRLNMDGSLQLASDGARIPNYRQQDISEMSRALTGWRRFKFSDPAIPGWAATDYTKPMIKDPANYDDGAKSFLGVQVAAGASQEASVAAVVDAVFNHPSTAPFVARHMIVHLVTANPSPGYVARVAAVFADNGKGIRGDMKAVVRAVLTDNEARGAPTAISGKVKEPVLVLTSMARVMGLNTDGLVFTKVDVGLGQPVMRAPTVFNFYSIDFPLPGHPFLKSPATKLSAISNVLRTHNFVRGLTIGSATGIDYRQDGNVVNSTGSTLDWGPWEAFGSDSEAMIQHIDLLLFANTLGPAHKDALRAVANSITDADPAKQARRRAQSMLYIAGTSPLFLVDR